MHWLGRLDRTPARARMPVFLMLRHNSGRAHDDSMVVAALDEMDFEAVQAIWLVDVCGLSYQEAATATRSEARSFTKTLHRARLRVLRSVGAS